MVVKIRYHKEKYPDLVECEQHGNFIDLRCAEHVEMKKGEHKYISLGVSMEIPEGYWGQLVPRSSTFKKHHILMANSFGVIDTDYCGDGDIWHFSAYATEDTVIEPNTRIAQFRIVKNNDITLRVVDKLENEDRGGLGSTGL